MTWYADPSGATERCELRCAGLCVLEGNNALRPGIAAVSARIEGGRAGKGPGPAGLRSGARGAGKSGRLAREEKRPLFLWTVFGEPLDEC